MRRLFFTSLFIWTGVYGTAQADGGFVRDVDYSSLSQVLSTTTFGDLAVGDSAYAYQSTFCWRNDELHVVAIYEINEPFDWSVNLKITRKTGGVVEVETELGERADADDLKSTVMGFAVRESCDEALSRISFDPNSVTLLKVLSVNGFTSLSDLAASLAESGVEKTGGEPATAPSVSSTDIGWLVTEEPDEITDQPNVYLTRFAMESQRGKFGSEWTPKLTLRCMRNTSAVIVRIEDYMVEDRIPVSYRFDDSAPEAGRWSVATNRKAVGLWSGRKSIPFLKRLVEAERLTMRVETRDGVHTFAFDISGARAHVEKLAKACNWIIAVDNTETRDSAGSEVGAGLTRTMTIADKDALRLGIKQHFFYSGNRSDRSLQVTIEIRLGRGAKFIAIPKLLKASGGNEAARNALFQAGRRALLKAQGTGEFKHLPLEKYNAWKIIAIVFTPDEISISSMP